MFLVKYNCRAVYYVAKPHTIAGLKRCITNKVGCSTGNVMEGNTEGMGGLHG